MGLAQSYKECRIVPGVYRHGLLNRVRRIPYEWVHSRLLNLDGLEMVLP